MHDNRLSTFPTEISLMTAMTYLDASWNRLKELPDVFGSMVALNILFVWVCKR